MDRGLYEQNGNVPNVKVITFKFFPDAGNQPSVPTNPQNLFITSIVWVSQGLYRITLPDSFKLHMHTDAVLNVSAAGVARTVQGGPVVLGASSNTVDLLVVDNAGAVQNPPAANASNWISGEIVFCDSGAV